MTLQRRLLGAALLALALAGCAGGRTGSAGRTPRAPDEGLVFGPIAENALPGGSCGMVLWTLEDQTPQPILRFVPGKSAEANVNGVTRSFRLVEASGPSRYGVSERQVFTAEGGLDLTVTVAFGLGFDGGHYLERGLAVIEDGAGWRTVAPVAGLAGCRAG